MSKRDFTAQAEAIFRDFAKRHSFSIEKVEQTNIELLMRVPKQLGLSFDLSLGLQNNDELSIGFQEFWSYFFPFEEEKDLVTDILDALVLGKCRLATHWQFGRACKRELEMQRLGNWQPAYSAYSRVKMPFFRTTISYLYNQGAKTSHLPGERL